LLSGEAERRIEMFDVIRRPSDALGLSTFEEMDNLFDNFLRTVGLPSNSFSLPSLDIYSTNDDHMVVEMQAPGFDTEDIELNVRNGILEIKGEKAVKEEQKTGKKNYLVRERNASFARRVVLPEGADTDNISAELDKGLLKISVPVNRPKAQRIQIKAGSTKHAQKLSAKADSK
jgi:HSP20 family protein